MELLRTPTVALLFLLSLSYGSTDEKLENAMAVIVFNATLPMMQFTVDGTNFHQQLLHMSANQVQKLRTDALAYFKENFGVDPQQHKKDVAIRLYETNPVVNMRCVYLSGVDDIPPAGLRVRDGGVMMTVINPNGIILGGRYPGSLAVFGTTFSMGHWVIERPEKEGKKLEPIIWKNRHSSPGGVALYEEGSRTFHGEMEVISNEWGVGQSLHVAKYHVNSKGKANAQLRNVITF